MSASKPLTAIPSGFGSGGAGLYPNIAKQPNKTGKKPDLEQLLNEHRAAILALQGEVPEANAVARFATTANIDLATTGLTAIDGVTPVAGDVALVKSQTTAAQNGLYVVSAGAWTLVTDDAGNSTLKEGMLVSVAEGSTNGGKLFVLASDGTSWNSAITASLSSSTPAAVAAAGAAGSASTASKSDHAHADPMRAAAGTNLTDSASQTIQVSGGNWRKISTVSQDSTVHLATTGAVAGDQIDITRIDATSAHTITIHNDGAGANDLFVMPNSKIAWARVQFDGTNWALRAFGQQ